jgi:2'-5' RNA ligase
VSGTARARAFFALSIGEDARRELSQAIETLRAEAWGERVRWLPSESLHLTLRFLGDVETERIPALLAAARGAVADVGAFACRATRVSGFPSASRTRVVAAQVEPEAPLAVLSGLVERVALEAGFDAEPRPFRAHVTLGRVRRPPLRGVSIDAALSGAPIPVDRVVLYRSELARDGARYTRLGEAPLQRAPSRAG